MGFSAHTAVGEKPPPAFVGRSIGAELHVSCFYGGKHRGTCWQISIGEEIIQLTRNETRKLASALVDEMVRCKK